VITNLAEEQNAAARAAFLHARAADFADGTLNARMILVIDVTALARKDAQRKYGYAFRGSPAFKRRYNMRGTAEGISAICALSIEGMKVATLYDGTVNADMFMHALVEDILPICNPYPGERSVLYFDNAAKHQMAGIYARCYAKGVLAIFLVPYSYDLSPIKPSFHSAKAYMRRVYANMVNAPPFVTQLRDSLLRCCTPDMACNMFQNCHIPITAEDREWANL
jgi:hypothetical protein